MIKHYSRITRRICSVLAIILLFVYCSHAQEKYSMVFKYKKGNTYRYQSESTVESTSQMMQQEIKSTGGSLVTVKMVVDDVTPSGDMSFVTSLEDIKVSLKGTGFDTTLRWKELIGKRSGITFSRYGEVLSTRTIDSVKLGTIEMGLGELGKTPTSNANNLFRLPDHPVKTGEKWSSEKNDSTKTETLKSLTKSHIQYTLEGKEKKNGHDCLKISYKGKFELTGKINQMEMVMYMEGSGDQKGEIWFDPASGILIAQESTVNQDFTMAMTGQMSMTIPTTQSVKTHFDLKE